MMGKILLKLAIVLIILLSSWTGIIPTEIPQSGIFCRNHFAIALLRQHHETPGVLRYHSQTSVYDDTHHVWQVILFKQPLPANNIHLRLVGFPGVVEFSHPHSLEVKTAQGKLLSATDIYNLENAPAPNVGEYLFDDVLAKLLTTDKLRLRLPLKNGSDLVLKIPENIVTEWQLLVTEFE